MGGHLAFVLTLTLGVAADLISKTLAFRAVPLRADPIEVIPGFFYIAHAENDGAMWSLFQGLPSWFWVVLRGTVFLVILAYYLAQGRRYPWWIRVAFGLVLAGALGNLFDNTFGNGRVRDWLKFVFWGWAFPTFNVADSMICVGAGLLLLYFMFLDSPKRNAARRPASEARVP